MLGVVDHGDLHTIQQQACDLLALGGRRGRRMPKIRNIGGQIPDCCLLGQRQVSRCACGEACVFIP
jgi:hypothetical protein